MGIRKVVYAELDIELIHEPVGCRPIHYVIGWDYSDLGCIGCNRTRVVGVAKGAGLTTELKGG
jgi:hypothetical protein